jgi:hypothetical protein
MVVTTAENGRMYVHNMRLGAVAAGVAAFTGAKPGAAVGVRVNPLGVAAWGADLLPREEPQAGEGAHPLGGVAAVCGADGSVALVIPRAVLSRPAGGKAPKGKSVAAGKEATLTVMASLAATVQNSAATGKPEVVLTCGGERACEPVVVDAKMQASAMDVRAAVTTRPEQAMFRCRWGPDVAGVGSAADRLLVVGGSAGVLRLLRLRPKRGAAVASQAADDGDESEE